LRNDPTGEVLEHLLTQQHHKPYESLRLNLKIRIEILGKKAVDRQQIQIESLPNLPPVLLPLLQGVQ
jgi:hypothetical protein